MIIRFFLLSIILFCQTAMAAQRVDVSVMGEVLPVWMPDEVAQGKKYPLVIFSHGYGGCWDQSLFLTKGLADKGYFVAAPKHQDAICAAGDLVARETVERNFDRPDQWSDETESDRGLDVKGAIDAVLGKAELAPFIDTDHIGLVGHSLGGYTVLGVAGAWPAWTDARVRAVVAYAPYTRPFLVHDTMPGIKIPVMMQTGTNDARITSDQVIEGYNALKTPSELLSFKDAGHQAWTNGTGTYHQEILTGTLRFFDYFLRGQPIQPIKSSPLVALQKVKSK